MGQRITVADAFTDRPFAGNPAAVCVLEKPASEQWMQAVAREMNLSETAFLTREEDGFRLRWFTPAVEVVLCGHATLAAAHVLWEEGFVRIHEAARFHTLSGVLSAERSGEWIELDFPSKPATLIPPPDGLETILGAAIRTSGQNGMDMIVELESEQAVRALQPDLSRLAIFPVRGLIVTSRAETAGIDFVSRFFAPRAGVPEDPVTGSAHCCLAPYWAERLGRSEMLGYQASARGGFVRVRLEGPRVRLGGQAVTVWRGELLAGA
jgi:predicted PhzF superfamily epimerase YddE/YHI9